MNDEQESVAINGEGIIAALAALVGFLEGREIMTRAEFAAELRTRSLTASPELGTQLLAVSDYFDPPKSTLTAIDGGKRD